MGDRVKKGIFFVSDDSIRNNQVASNGIGKKILSQLSALNDDNRVVCELVNLPRPLGNPLVRFLMYMLGDIYKATKIDFTTIDFVYIRRIVPNNHGLIKLLQTIKSENPGCKIVYEIPTYPYEQEHKTLKSKVILLIDILYRNKLRRYVDRIVTVEGSKNIFGIKTIRMSNGIKCSDLPVVSARKDEHPGAAIHMVAVAQFASWHGYDRMIEGMREYYRHKYTTEVTFHLVGNGDDLERYKELVEKYSLKDHVVFHGALYGEALTAVFTASDIAICSLGCHRISIYLSSQLKSREYLARGLPIISSTKIDIIPNNYKYCLYVPEDDSPINISDIIIKYKNWTEIQSRETMISEIRAFAEANCDISKTMKSVIDYIAC